MKTTILSTTTTTAIALTFMAFAGSVHAETYKVDAAASKIEWKAGKKIGSFHNGQIKIKQGELTTDAKGQLTKGQIVVDMKTISNEDLKDNPEYQQKLVGHLSSDDFFKVEKFPESTFSLTSISPKKGSKTEYVVKGTLNMLGKENAIEFPAQLQADKATVKATATVAIERLKWNLQYGSGSIFKTLTADKIINDTFDLKIDLVAKK